MKSNAVLFRKLGMMGAIASAVLINLSQLVSATTLLQVYQEAYRDAPSLQAQHATLEADQAAVGVNFGALLPQVSMRGSANMQDTQGLSRYHTESVSFQASQDLFNLPDFFSYQAAGHMAEAAQSTYEDQEQQFIIQVVSAYFAVVNAHEQLEAAHAQTAFLKSTLGQIQAKFQVGLSTQTDLAQAKAQYDAAKASEISAQNALDIAWQQLETFTGKAHTHLKAFSSTTQLGAPQPASLSWWMNKALIHNHQIQAARETQEATYSNLQSGVGSGFFPTVSLVASWSYQRNDTEGRTLSVIGYRSQNNGAIGLQFTWDLFQSGGGFAATSQLAHQYAAQSYTTQALERSVHSQTQQDYLAVMTDSSAILAYQASVQASQASLSALQAEYKAGTVTLVEVLNGVEQLFTARVNLANQKYQYVLNWLSLQADIGSLSARDVKMINQWL